MSVCTVIALAVALTFVYVPVRWGTRLVAPPTDEQVSQLQAQIERQVARAPQADRERESAYRQSVASLLDGQTVYPLTYDDAAWNTYDPVWTWSWDRDRERHELSIGYGGGAGSSGEVSIDVVVPLFQVEVGEFIWWKLVFLEQALILLLGGGALTVVVRRARHRKPATT